MLSEIDKSLLKEFDHHNVRADVISKIMNQLNTTNNKSIFLSYLSDNHNLLITDGELFHQVYLILHKDNEVK